MGRLFQSIKRIGITGFSVGTFFALSIAGLISMYIFVAKILSRSHASLIGVICFPILILFIKGAGIIEKAVRHYDYKE